MKRGNEQIWDRLEQLRGDPVVRESLAYARQWESQVREDKARARRAALPRFAWAMAAAVAVAVLSVTLPWSGPWSGSVIATGTGEVRTVMLEDGSRVILDAQSRVEPRFSRDHRDLELRSGTAHFEVAKDAARPFRVRAGNAEIVAIGTVFDITVGGDTPGSDTQNRETTVTLIEGKVEVRAVTAAAPAAAETLVPGQQVKVALDGKLLARRTASVEAVTAWQRGLLNFDDMPVAAAVSQVNRYSSIQVTFGDKGLAAARVSGVFRTGDTRAFVVALERLFGVRAEWRSDGTVVLRSGDGHA